MNGDKRTCRLRRLTLCDGHHVEEPDRALTACPCEVLEIAQHLGDKRAQQRAIAHRQDLLERLP